jgi:hypothetical protein
MATGCTNQELKCSDINMQVAVLLAVVNVYASKVQHFGHDGLAKKMTFIGGKPTNESKQSFPFLIKRYIAINTTM